MWLVRRKNGVLEVLLQKRSDEKDSFPGCYDISSAGHIPAGQGFVDSALRELKEELGVTAQPQDLILCGQRSFQFSAVFHGKPFKDNQVSNVYLLWLDRDAEEFTLQKREISAVRWMPLCRLFARCGERRAEQLHFPRRAADGAGHGGKGKRNLIEEIILWESCGKWPSLIFFILPCNNAGLFDVFDREGTGKPNAGSCFPRFMSLGNTAQFPPCGKHRSGSCGTASALPKCSIMSG